MASKKGAKKNVKPQTQIRSMPAKFDDEIIDDDPQSRQNAIQQMKNNGILFPSLPLSPPPPPPSPPPLPPTKNVVFPSKKVVQRKSKSRYSSKMEYAQEQAEDDADDAYDADNQLGTMSAKEEVFRPTPNVLQKAKTRLRSINSQKAKVSLGRSKLFDSLDSPNFYPLEKLKDLFTVNNATVDSLDLTGVEQLTDVFFGAVQFLHKNSLFCQHVTGITLQGCNHITDTGVKLIIETFPKLQTVSLIGCSEVTEKSVTRLLSCPKIESINLTSTNVGMVHLPSRSDIFCSLLLEGCPLLSPPCSVYKPTQVTLMTEHTYFKSATHEGSWNVYKALVVNVSSTEVSLLKSLVTGKVSKLQTKVPFVFSDYEPNKEFFMNVFECSEEMAHLFISDRTVFLLPYNATSDIKDICAGIERRLMPILTKVENANVLLVGHSGTSKKAVANSIVLTHVKKRLEDNRKELQQILTNLYSKLYSRSEAIDFAEQMKMTSVFRLLDGIETVDLKADVTLNEGQTTTELQSALIEAVRQTNLSQPFYSTLPKAFSKMAVSFAPKPGIRRESEVIAELRSAHKSDFGGNYQTYRKALQLMHMAGQLIYFADAEVPVVVTDRMWFADELKSFLTPRPSSDLSLVLIQPLLDSHIVCHVQDPSTSSLRLTWAGSLPVEPPMPWDYFLETKNSDVVCDLKYSFQFLHPLPPGLRSDVLCQLIDVNRTGDLKYPPSVWQTGFIRLIGPVTFGMRFLNAELDQPQIVLTAQVSKPKQEALRNSLARCLWNTLEFYRVVVEKAAKNYGFYCSVQMMFNNKTETVVPEGVTGITSGHQLVDMPDTTRHQSPATTICQNCSIDNISLSQIWKTKKSLLPTFQTGKLFGSLNGSVQTERGLGQSAIENVQMKGSWIGTSPGEVVIPLPQMNPVDFSRFSFTILLGETFVITMKSLPSATVQFTFDLKDRVARGDVVTVLLREIAESKPPLTEVLILLNEEILAKSEPLTDVRLNPYLVIKDHANFLLDTSLASIQSMAAGLAKWEPGMRVEALDRQTPNLICAASISQVNKAGELLVHFDGWSEHYDYWADPKSTDIHPIGWFAQRIFNHTEFNVTLQPPRNYQKVFEWEQYLIDVIDVPAPYELFTQEQTENCTPFHFKMETILFLQSHGKGMSCVERCGLEKRHPEVLAAMALKNWTYSVAGLQCETPVAVFLPRAISAKHLLFPSNKIIPLLSDQAWHFICAGRGECRHFLDVEGVPIKGSNVVLSNYYQAVASVVTQYEFKLPENIKNLIADAEELKPKELQEQLRRFLSTLFWNLCIVNSEYGDDDADYGEHTELKGKHSELFSLLWNEQKGNETLKSLFVSEGTDNVPVCQAHHHSHSSGKGLTEVSLDAFKNCGNFIVSLDLSVNLLESLPNNFFPTFPVIQILNLSKNRLRSLPNGIGSCGVLAAVDVSHNCLEKLPEDFRDANPSLRVLNISNNPLGSLPECIISLTLEELHASSTGIRELPADIGQLENLIVLKLAENQLGTLPPTFANLSHLTDLDLSGVRWIETNDTKMLLTQSAFNDFLNENPCTAAIEKKERDSLFSKYDEKNQGTLDYQAIQLLNAELFEMFTRFGKEENAADPYAGCPKEIFFLKTLLRLNLSFQGFRRLTEHIEELKQLEELILSHNPVLEALPGEISGLTSLKEMPLRGCVSLKTPPKEIVRRGFSAIFGYLRRLKMGSVECKRTKLMMVGLGGAGKTSLVHSLTQGQYVSSGSYGAKITDGIDITTWDVSHDGESVRFSVWDFAGQTVYYNTHQFFLSNRAVYLLLWNIRLGYEHAGLDFWLSSIACHAPKAPIIIVGSHKDQVQKYWFPEADMKKRYPQIQAFFAVSSFNGDGISELRLKLGEVARKEKYMGERIPEVWLNFERRMLNERAHYATLTWEKVVECAFDTGIADQTELFQAVQFLHDLGSVQHFQNEYLKSRVVINPQWIVDAMSCMVSVQDTSIKEGKLYHDDLGKIWGRYDEQLRPWLLRLTEEFDLTFPSKDEAANIIPCLLPASEPEFDWPDVNSVAGRKELKMVYKFDYLPAGLFNRIQVRLYQFSDSSHIWKNGSYLHKNGHLAMLRTQEASDVLVKVQGPRPENILFLVNEVIEALIFESFHGVHYDYQLPCTDCIKAGSYDPCLFAASKIRRAVELKAPFLQCDMYFHTLSLAELQAMMPPDTGNFDMHLERSLVDLNNLRNDMSYDIFIIYCQDNIPQIGEDERKVSPRRIFNDLQLSGFRVWFSSDPASIVVEQVAVVMREAKIVLICGSNEFVKDSNCSKLFYLAKNSMQATIQLVLLGNGTDWIRSSEIGMRMSSEVFVNMSESHAKKYSHKITELCDSIRGKLTTLQPSTIVPKVFISYCWCNSHDAVTKGTKEQPGSLGWGDPRKLKDFLEDNGIHCWMDIHKVQGKLFKEIAEGLRRAKVILVCASDEYAKSKNCMMEFRFAATQLQLPLVLAAMGTSQKWEASEVGMLSIDSPRVSFQHESPDANDRLLRAIKMYITDEDIEEERSAANSPATTADNNQRAFQELLELAQRKFLRQVISYADSTEYSPYPRLFVLDFLTDDEKQLLQVNAASSEEQKSARNAASSEEQKSARNAASSEEQKSVRNAASSEEQKSARNAASSEEQKSARNSDQAQATGEGKDGRKADTESRGVDEKKSENRPSSRESTSRPTSAAKTKAKAPLVKRLTSKNLTSYIVETLTKDAIPAEKVTKDYEYCIRILCENEEGWHRSSGYIPLEPMEPSEWDAFLSDIAGYMARFIAILKHTTLDLGILVGSKAEQLCKILEEKCGVDPDFKSQYVYIRKLAMSLDEKHERFGLSRCRLLNGKTVWLCPDHQKQDRVTILSDESAEVSVLPNEGAVESEIMSQAIAGKKIKQENSEQESRKQNGEQISGKRTKEELNKANYQQSQAKEPSQKGTGAKEIPSRENSSAKKRQPMMDATGVETSPEEKQGPVKTNSRGKLIGAAMAARIAGGYSLNQNNTSKACILM